MANDDLVLKIDYDGPVWEDKTRKDFNDLFKIKVVSLYKTLKKYSTVCRVINNSFNDPNIKINPDNIKKWIQEVKGNKSYIIDKIEQEEEVVANTYKQIHQKAIENTKELLDLILEGSIGMDGEKISKAAVNMVNIAEKMNTLDPATVDKTETLSDSVVFELSVENKLEIIATFKKLLSEEQIDNIENTFKSLNENVIIDVENENNEGNN